MPLFILHLITCTSGARYRFEIFLPGLAAAKFAARYLLARRALDAAVNAEPFPAYDVVEICNESGRVLDIEWCWALVRNPDRPTADVHSMTAATSPQAASEGGQRRRDDQIAHYKIFGWRASPMIV